MSIKPSLLLLCLIASLAQLVQPEQCDSICCKSDLWAEFCKSLHTVHNGRTASKANTHDTSSRKVLSIASRASDELPKDRSHNPDKCNDPEYACQSLYSADECDSLLFCADYWTGKRYEAPSNRLDSACRTCQVILSDVHMVRNPLSHIEALLPIQRHLTQLLQLRNLSNGGVSPGVLCFAIGECSAGRLVNYQADSLECVFARSAWSDIAKLLRQKLHYAEIKETLINQCTGDARCEQALLHTIPFFINNYLHHLEAIHSSEQPCVDLLACSPSKNSMFCDVCVSMMMYIKKTISNNETVNSFSDAMKKICVLLGPRKDECVSYIDEHAEMWMDNIAENFKPDKVCADMKLCSANQLAHVEDSLEEFVGVVCEHCEKFVVSLRKKTLCKVKRIFNFFIPNLCRMLGPLESKCIHEAFAVKAKIIDIVNATIREEKLCRRFCQNSTTDDASSLLHFNEITMFEYWAELACEGSASCQNGMSQFISKTVDLISDDHFPPESMFITGPIEVMVGAKTDCDICRGLDEEDIKIVFWQYEDKMNEIVHGLKALCTGPGASNCTAFLDRYAKKIKFVATRLQETGRFNQFCELIDACGEDVCEICSQVSGGLRKLLPSNTHDRESVREAISKVCSLVNEQLPLHVCEGFVDNFNKTITSLLVDLMTKPSQLCNGMGVCSSHANQLAMSSCDMCLIVARVARDMIAKNTTEAEIIQLVEKACAQLHSPYNEKCKQLVDAELPRIIELIGMMAQPEAVCSYIGFCQAAAGHPSYCTSCQMLAIFVRAWLDNEQAIDHFATMLNRSCEYFFADRDLRVDCMDSVNSLKRVLAHELQHFDSLKLCSFAHMCPQVELVNGRVHATAH